jgi:hypothetical protein
MHPMLFSPFDALGIDVLKVNTTPGDWRTSIEKAWRRVSRICHPDQRYRHGLPVDRWPLQIHCEAAKQYLIDHLNDGRLGEVIERFSLYPRTFSPESHPRFNESLILPNDFTRCDLCMMVLRHEDYRAHHQADHPTSSGPSHDPTNPQDRSTDYPQEDWTDCPFCKTPRPTDELDEHFRRDHGCTHQATAELDGIYHKGWICLCGIVICREYVLKHLRNSHDFRVCSTECRDVLKACRSYEDVEQELDRHPYWTCLIPDCSRVSYRLDTLANHLLVEHELSTCVGCCRTCLATHCQSHTTTHFWQHLTDAHHWKRCHLCPPDMPQAEGSSHLISKHGWLQCTLCADVLPDAGDMDEHMKQHKRCSHCDELLTDDQFERHLHVVHDLRVCYVPLCGEILSPGEFIDHFAMSHNQTEICKVCGGRHSGSGLPYHMLEDHRWVRCAYCGDPLPPDEVEAHEEVKHNVRLCDECGERVPGADLEDHRMHVHQLKRCPFSLCRKDSNQRLFTETELARHIRHQHPELESAEANIHVDSATPNAEPPSLMSRLLRPILELRDPRINTEFRRVIQSLLENESATNATPNPDIRPSQPGDAARETLVCFPADPVAAEELRVTPPSPSGSRKAARPDGKISNNPPDIIRQLTGKAAILNFIDLVAAFRDTPVTHYQAFHSHDRGLDHVAGLSTIADNSEKYSRLNRVFRYASLYCMAEALDKMKEVSARRSNPAHINSILQLRRLEPSVKNRTKIKNQIQLGRELKTFVRSNDGLLCFIATGNDWKRYKKLSPDDHQRLLSQYSVLWEAGHRLLEIWKGRFKATYRFEGQSVDSSASVETLRRLLEVQGSDEQ